MQRGLRVITLQGAIKKSPILLSQFCKNEWLYGTIISSYFGGSNNNFADCTIYVSLFYNLLFYLNLYLFSFIIMILILSLSTVIIVPPIFFLYASLSLFLPSSHCLSLYLYVSLFLSLSVEPFSSCLSLSLILIKSFSLSLFLYISVPLSYPWFSLSLYPYFSSHLSLSFFLSFSFSSLSLSPFRDISLISYLQSVKILLLPSKCEIILLPFIIGNFSNIATAIVVALLRS